MNAYRSYMDRARLPGGAHARLMSALESGEKPERRRYHFVQWGAAAACLALICLTGWGAWRWSTPHMGGDLSASDSLIPGEKDTYGPGETPSATPTPAPSVEPFVPTLVFADRTNDPEPAMSIVLPKGSFRLPISGDGCLEVLGIAKPPSWEEEPYTVSGEFICDGEGRLWQATISGVSDKDADKTFTIKLAQGRLPLECVVYEGGTENEIGGVSIQADYFLYDRDGDGRDEYVSRAAFMNRDIGVRVEVIDHADTRVEAESLTRAILRGNGGRLSAVPTEEIPEWRSEARTLDEARAEAGFGKYVPSWVPGGFGFESGWREMGQGRDWLHVSWTGYYTDISVSIYRAEFYPQADSDEAPILVTEMTRDRLGQLMEYVDNDGGDMSGYRGRFAVDYLDGFVVEYSFKGVTALQVGKMLDQITWS